MNLESFEKAFSDNVGSCRAQCACGKEYYSSSYDWDWGEGELEALEADMAATGFDEAVEFVSFEGQTFVLGCDCWQERAKRIMNFLDSHMQKIADYFKHERAHKIEEAEAVPEF